MCWVTPFYTTGVSQIFRLFVNILTPDEYYSPSVKVSVSSNQFKCNYLRN